MGDEGEYWRDVAPHMKEASRVKRAGNRSSSRQMLVDAGVPFEEKNEGAHLIIRSDGVRFDFWPGTGKWWQLLPGSPGAHSRYEGRGVRPLLARLRKVVPQLARKP